MNSLVVPAAVIARNAEPPPKKGAAPARATRGVATTTDEVREVVRWLRFYGDTLTSLERQRIQTSNRRSILLRSEPDADGVMRGFGVAPDSPDALAMDDIVDELGYMERQAERFLVAHLRRHPLAPWLKAQRGLAEKQAARLLAVIGDPYIRTAMVDDDGQEITPEGPRTVSALWAYCGLHVREDEEGVGHAVKRQRGVRANWSPEARMRVYLLTTSCLKQLVAPCAVVAVDGISGVVHQEGDACRCSPFRLVYDRRKAYTASTRPAWTDMHRHMDALRLMGKEILKQVWRGARDFHRPDLAAQEAIDGAPVAPAWMSGATT